MTLRELSQLYFLRREIEMDERRLLELREKSNSPPSPRIGGITGAGNSESRIERYAEIIAALETVIEDKRERCAEERLRLEQYIADIPDSFLRQIFTLRFIGGLSWVQVAVRLHTSTAAVKMMCYRYINGKPAENTNIPAD